MTVRTVQFLAIVIAALALIPSGAHLAALPNKITMPQTEYFTVQAIYYQWAILGLLWPAAMFCFVLMLIIFFIWTQPANQATQNWTVVPENWDALRHRWEYSHAANAALVFIALSSTILSVLAWRPSSL
jgi:hypothetical protein